MMNRASLADLVRRCQADASLTDVAIADHLGIPRQMWFLKRTGERSINGQELVALFGVLPQLLVELAAALGQRVVPITEEAQRADVVHAATRSIREVTEAGAYAMDALSDGRIDRMEGIECLDEIGDARQALADFEASIQATRAP